MKKKAMILARSFYPESNGTISCVEKICLYLCKEWDIDVYCNKIVYESPLKEERQGVTINRIPPKLIDKIMQYREWQYKKLDNATVKDIKWQLTKRFLQLIYFIPVRIARNHGIFYNYSRYKSYHKHVYRKIEKVADNYEYIICTGEPFDDAIIVEKLIQKHPHLKWIFMQFDLYANNPCMSTAGYKERLQIQRKWYEKATLIITQNEMMPYVKTTGLDVFSDKILGLFVPTMSSISTREATSSGTDRIKIVYTGNFYKDIRNPEIMLQQMSHVLEKQKNVDLYILGGGNCNDILKEYQKKIGSQMIICGMCSREETEEMQEKADILLNVSNSIREMVPSKIMEYIGTRKPIINYYSIDDDVCQKYLSEYPLCYSVDGRKAVPGNVDDMIAFITANAGKLCSYEEVCKNYNQYSAENFAQTILNALKNSETGKEND